jgi:hypothetical protein
MRRVAVLMLVCAIPSAPLAAQFEGTIHMKMSSADGRSEPMTMTMVMKGDKEVSIMSMPASAGPMAGMEMRSIYDATTNTLTALMPMPPGMPAMPGMGDAKGIKTVMDMSKMSPRSDEKVDIKKLGTSEKIAGLDCDDYEITQGSGKVSRACITQSIGKFVFPGGFGGMGRRGNSAPPGWARAFGDKPGFPLKVWSADGGVDLEVTSVEKGSVPASVFEIPAGYVDMAGMRGRGGIQ